MDDQKNQLIDKLKSATNILVTVSQNPSVDQLAACIGVTLALNKQGKHATAVFSGDIPNTIEFLQPEATIERNTDSLRDFIIALDKSKADKLRYKVEDRVVKIFITPYKTSISDKDLNFSQGDFNVDAVLALGVHEQQDLDQAITSHGRILHDATVLGINQQPGSELASINWVEPAASSLSELTAQLLDTMDKDLLDQQIATALLTGVVAATDRFRNDNTTAQTMSVSALLMRAGANQQLVTSQLAQSADSAELPSDGDDNNAESDQGNSEKPQSKHSKKHDKPAKKDPGMLEINHDEASTESDKNDEPAEILSDEPAAPSEPVALPEPTAEDVQPDGNTDSGRDVMTEPPTFDSALTANDRREEVRYNPAPDMASDQPSSDPLLSHSAKSPASTTLQPATTEPSRPEPPVASTPTPPVPAFPAPPVPALPSAGMPEAAPAQPLPPSQAAEGEASVPDQTIDVDDARDEVMRALSEQPDETMPPIAALNAQPLGGSLHDAAPSLPAAGEPATPPPTPAVQPTSTQPPASQPLDMPLPPSSAATPTPPSPAPSAAGNNADAPPSVPPPLMPPNWPPKQ